MEMNTTTNKTKTIRYYTDDCIGWDRVKTRELDECVHTSPAQAATCEHRRNNDWTITLHRVIEEPTHRDVWERLRVASCQMMYSCFTGKEGLTWKRVTEWDEN